MSRGSFSFKKYVTDRAHKGLLSLGLNLDVDLFQIDNIIYVFQTECLGMQSEVDLLKRQAFVLLTTELNLRKGNANGHK